LEKLKGMVANRLAATGSKGSTVEVEFGAVSSCVLTGASSYEEDGEPDLAAMDVFAPDTAAQLEEAKKLGGLLRLKWYLVVVKAIRKASKKEEDKKGESPFRPLALGVGFAVDETLAKARALRAAEVRAEVLTEAMFLKPGPKG